MSLIICIIAAMVLSLFTTTALSLSAFPAFLVGAAYGIMAVLAASYLES